MSKRSTRPSTYYGKRVGTKRADRRWQSPDGELWDSRYEYLVYIQFRQEGYDIIRCGKSDTFSFTLPIRGGECRDCKSTSVGQRRTYTPDFYIVSTDSEHPPVKHYIETKGYLRPKERALLRAFYKEKPDTRLSFLFQRSYPASAKRADGTKGSIMDWMAKFLPQFGAYIWDGAVPTGVFNSADTGRTGNQTGMSLPSRSTKLGPRKKSSRRRKGSIT